MNDASRDGWVHQPPGPQDDLAAEAAIRHYMVRAMLAGAIPVPVLDLVAVGAVQLAMLEELARIYRAPLDPRSAQALLTTAGSALLGNAASRAALSVFKLVPVVGWLGGGMALVVTTGASTYAVGQVFARLFRERRPLEDLDVATVMAELKAQIVRGRAVAAALYQEARKAGPG